MNKHLIALAAATVFLAGCGGGSDEAASTSTASTPAAAAAQFRTTLAAQGGTKVAAAVSPAQAAEQLLNFAEATFPSLFPTHQATGTLDPFLFRYYPQTGIYVGVVVKAGMGFTLDGVYLLGGPFGNTPFYVGQLGNFITPVDTGPGGPTGPNNGCFDLAGGEQAGNVLLTSYEHSGFSTGNVTTEARVIGPQTFNGFNVVESSSTTTGTLTTMGNVVSQDSQAKSYSKRTGDAEVTRYGTQLVTKATVTTPVAGTTTTTIDVTYDPPFVDRWAGIALGQSITQTTTSKSTITVQTAIAGVPVQLPPQVTVNQPSTSSQTIKFVARESITVPAGTYSACKFELSSPGESGVQTTWLHNGKGVLLKTTSVIGGVTSTQQATSIKLNGQPL